MMPPMPMMTMPMQKEEGVSQVVVHQRQQAALQPAGASTSTSTSSMSTLGQSGDGNTDINNNQYHQEQQQTTNNNDNDDLMLLDLPNKEAAVAALSATLAFRRFDNHHKLGGGSLRNSLSGGESLSADQLDGSAHSCYSGVILDPMEDSLRRLSSLLSQGNHAGVRRPTLETIVSGRISNDRSNGGLRNSLRSSGVSSFSGYFDEIQELTTSDLKQPHASFAAAAAGNYHRGDDNNDSLNSDDLQYAKEGFGENDMGGDDSMTISLLESKKLSSEYSHLDGTTASDSDDDDSSTSSKSIDLDAPDFGNSDKKVPNSLVPSNGDKNRRVSGDSNGATRGFISSLQRILDSSGRSKTTSASASSSKVSAASSSSKSKPHSSSKENNGNNNHSLSWSRKISTTSSKSSGRSHTHSSRTSNSNHNSSWHSSYQKKLSDSYQMKLSQRDSYQKKLSQQTHGKKNSNYSSNCSANNNMNVSWKDASNLSGCLKNASSSKNNNNGNLNDIENNRSIEYEPKQMQIPKKKTRVSWNIDDNDVGDELNYYQANHHYNVLTTGMGSSGPQLANLLSDGSTGVRPQLVNSLLSEGTAVSSMGESIDFGRLSSSRLSSSRSRRNHRQDLASSLMNDEQLLASMMQLANLSNSLQLSESTGEDHASLSSSLTPKRKHSVELESATTDNVEHAATTPPNGIVVQGVNFGEATEVIASPSSLESHGEESSSAATAASINKAGAPARKILGQESLRRLVRETTPSGLGLAASGASSSSQTAAAVTRLAYQEVEDYRTRLQRKRATLHAMDNTKNKSCENSGTSSQEEAEEFSELLLENATNISNALLLQRALFTLRMSGDPVNNNSGTAGSSTAGTESASNNNGSDSNAFMPRAHSENTGIDRMALNHFLNISSSATHSAPNASLTSGGHPSNANWNLTSSNTNGPNSRPSNPFTALLNRRRNTRRNTYQEGNEPQPQPSTPVPQIGAYQSNEPAPLLFARTYESGNRNRRELRAEARRNTLEALARERASSDAASAAVSERRGAINSVNFATDMFNSSGSTAATNRRRSDSLGYDDQSTTATETVTNTTPATTFATTMPQSSSNTSGGVRDNTIATASSGNGGSPNSHNSILGGRRNNVLYASVRHAATRPQSLISSTSTYRGGGEGVLDASDYGDASHLRNWLRASVHRQSFNSKRMLQAILVSDEIVEADHIETTLHDGTSSYDIEMTPTMQERMAMMEELLDEQDEERKRMLERSQKREKMFVIGLVLAVMIIVGLIIVIAIPGLV